MGGNKVFAGAVFASKWFSLLADRAHVLMKFFLLYSARTRSDLAWELGWKPEFDGTYLRSAIAEDMEVILRLTRI